MFSLVDKWMKGKPNTAHCVRFPGDWYGPHIIFFGLLTLFFLIERFTINFFGLIKVTLIKQCFLFIPFRFHVFSIGQRSLGFSVKIQVKTGSKISVCCLSALFCLCTQVGLCVCVSIYIYIYIYMFIYLLTKTVSSFSLSNLFFNFFY